MKRVTSELSESSLKKPASLDRWPRGITYHGGFRILGTPLGLGNALGSDLRFVATLNDQPPRAGERLIASHVLTQTFDPRRRLDLLGLNYGQTIRLGQMSLRLYPAGVGPGSAQLEVAIRDRRILYCGGVRLASPLLAAPPEVPRCDLLLLDAPPSEPKPPAPANAARALAAWLAGARDARRQPVVVFGNPVAAIDVIYAAEMAGMRVRVQRRLFEAVRRASGVLPLAHLVMRMSPTLREGEVGLVSVGSLARVRLVRGDAAVAFAGPGRQTPPFAEINFRMGETEDRPGLLAYIKETGASQVALSDACAAPLAAALAEHGVETFRVNHPEQMPLPFRF